MGSVLRSCQTCDTGRYPDVLYYFYRSENSSFFRIIFVVAMPFVDLDGKSADASIIFCFCYFAQFQSSPQKRPDRQTTAIYNQIIMIIITITYNIVLHRFIRHQTVADNMYYCNANILISMHTRPV
jgi:hypothetical protein